MRIPTRNPVIAGAKVYATWNSADKNANITLSGGDLIATAAAIANFFAARATVGKSIGKFYMEQTVSAVGGLVQLGVMRSTASIANGSYVGFDVNGWGYNSNGNVVNNSSNIATYATYTTADVIGMCFSPSLGKLWFSKNGVWQSGDPSAESGGITITSAVAWFPAFGGNNSGAAVANFGRTAFAYAPPTNSIGIYA